MAKAVRKGNHRLQENSGLINKANPLYSYTHTESKSKESSSRSSRSYGATHKPAYSTCDLKFIRHELTQDDTLQGLALKYEVTVEHIKRANKLWTNDNIHILESLIIPVKINAFKSLDSAGTSSDDAEHTSGTFTDEEHSSPVHDKKPEPKKNGLDPVDDKKPSLGDFLTKLDQQISSSKCQAEKFSKVTSPRLIATLEGITRNHSSYESSDDNYEPQKSKRSKTRMSKNKRQREDQEDNVRSDEEDFYEL